ncbi:MAG: DUF86 domain-containing protein [Candidatus Magnetobacterium sp. LHC-1]|uniref:DUF86 domain-containing protein n=1 Tax=Candidatus Magnetobacterium casense TaxID=1455061 RepID=A0ABS6RX46_9BACT|nr:DUF86 domain-containing protein [Candidatus Magnetobacterium casensis]MBF0606384.1 DUF86 domain-containing protein [Nitrospirota bacterium]MBV6341206.1 DUF86 domain-containing protein [Candidatus Magnetobacterium casensis]
MRRSCLIYIEDILTSTNKILDYVGESSFEEFCKNEMRLEAIERNFMIIGEATKNIPDEIRHKYPFVQWQRVIDFRNVLAHEYFGINKKIMWTIIKEKLPHLKQNIQNVLEQERTWLTTT